MDAENGKVPAPQEANNGTELKTDAGVASYMGASTSEADWNKRCDEVKAANNGNYPEFWFNKIIMSGMASRVSSKW